MWGPLILNLILIIDYINDTKSMLDQVPRVLSALMDIAISLRRGIPVVNLMRVNAMVYQVHIFYLCVDIFLTVVIIVIIICIYINIFTAPLY